MIILIIKMVFIFSVAHNPDLLERFVVLCYLRLLAYINIWMHNTRHIFLRKRIQSIELRTKSKMCTVGNRLPSCELFPLNKVVISVFFFLQLVFLML